MENGNIVLKKIIGNIENVIIGKTQAIELIMICLLSKGHVLIEDKPGVGKTSLVSALARSVDCSFKRIQFTPDIMPSDITGFSMFNQKTGEFEYKQGSIMSQFVLADEINRTSPKTQSSLLEVMEENQVTIDGKIYEVEQPFIVFATQNPVEYLGTYPLPEAQLDRFFMKVSIGYPDKADEQIILRRYAKGTPMDSLEVVASAEEVLKMQEEIMDIHLNDDVNSYIVALTSATRNNRLIALGASPRASLCLYRAAQARAYLQGRDFATPDDVQSLAPYVLTHRLIISQEAKMKRVSVENVLREVIESVKAPSI